MHQSHRLAARLGCTLVGTLAFKAGLSLLLPIAPQAAAGQLTAVSCVKHASLIDLTQPTAVLVLDAAAVLRPIAARLSELVSDRTCSPALLAACDPRFAALLRAASAVVGALLTLPAASEQATTVLLPGLPAVVGAATAVANLLALV